MTNLWSETAKRSTAPKRSMKSARIAGAFDMRPTEAAMQKGRGSTTPGLAIDSNAEEVTFKAWGQTGGESVCFKWAFGADSFPAPSRSSSPPNRAPTPFRCMGRNTTRLSAALVGLCLRQTEAARCLFLSTISDGPRMEYNPRWLCSPITTPIAIHSLIGADSMRTNSV